MAEMYLFGGLGKPTLNPVECGFLTPERFSCTMPWTWMADRPYV
jgi:hypothetical protein